MNVDFFSNDDDGYESVVIPNGYQQANKPPQCPDVEWDWFQEIDDDSWIIGEANSAPVGADLPNPAQLPEDAFPHEVQDADDDYFVALDSAPVVPDVFAAAQYFGDAAELYDEAIEQVVSIGGHQQADVAAAPSPQFFDDPYFDWEDSPPDYMADDFGNDDADPPVEDAWDWSQDDDEQVPLEDSSRVLPPATLAQYFGDDAELYDEAIEQVVSIGGYQQVDVAVITAASQFFDDPYLDWEEDSPPDYMADDFSNVDADPPVDDAWDWAQQEDDEQPVADDPIGASVPANPITPYEDGADLWTQDTDDDDWAARDCDPVAVSASVPAPIPYEDSADLWTQDTDEDEWTARDCDPVAADASVPAPIPYEDSADLWTQDTDEDEWAARDADPVAADASVPTPIPYEDSADLWTQDTDDEEWTARDCDPVAADASVPAPIPYEDSADLWTQDTDDDEWTARDSDSVVSDISSAYDDAWDWTESSDDEWTLDDSGGGGPAFVSVLDDGWDWLSDDVDGDFDFALDSTFTASPPPPSQFTDDAFDWTDDVQVEDQVDELHWIGAALGRLTGGPRYIIAGDIRLFSISRGRARAFSISRGRARAFKVSALMSKTFDTKDPSESVKLTFDFAPDLLPLIGVTLVTFPAITVSVVDQYGADPNPSSVLNGTPLLDTTSTKVIVPVKGGINNLSYNIRVIVATTDPLTTLELTGVLPVSV